MCLLPSDLISTFWRYTFFIVRFATIVTLLFILYCGICTASRPSPPPQSAHKEQHKSGQNDQMSAKDQRCTDQSPCTIKVLPSESSEAIAAQATENKNEKATNERLTAWATIALAIVTSILAFFTFRLWFATKTLVEGGEDAAKKELRAYVALDTIDHFSKNGPLRFSIRNYGQTPAHHVSIVHAIREAEQKSTYKQLALGGAR